MTHPRKKPRSGNGRHPKAARPSPQHREERLLLGTHAVLEALRAGTKLKRVWVGKPRSAAGKVVAAALEEAGVPFEEPPQDQLDALFADSGTEDRAARHQGVVAFAAPLPVLALEDLLTDAHARPFPLYVCLDEISDPHNFGAILRSAVALGTDGVIVPERRSAKVTEAVARVSAGATEHVRVVTVKNLAQALSTLTQAGIECLGLAAEGELPISRIDTPPTAGRALVIGSEGKGLRQLVRQRCTQLVHIPMTGPIASLNASAAAAIALHAANESRDTAMSEPG